MIRFEKVTKRYHYEAYPTLGELSFRLPEEKITTLMLETQSGKTTIAKLLTGTEKPTGGEIFLRGRNIAEIKPKERNIAYFPKKPLFFARGTLFKNLAYPLEIRGVNKNEISRRVLSLLAERGFDPKQRAKDLSEERAQELAFLRASLRDTELMLLDDLPPVYYPLINLLPDAAAVILTSKIENATGVVTVIKDNYVVFTGTPNGAREYIGNALWARGDEFEKGVEK